MKEKEKRKWRAGERVHTLFKEDYFSLNMNNITDIVSKGYATEFPSYSSGSLDIGANREKDSNSSHLIAQTYLKPDATDDPM